MMNSTAEISPGAEPNTRAHPVAAGRLTKVMTAMRQFATVSEVLRVLGALVMVCSMSVFLMQGWQAGNDVDRYLMLLAQTALLTAGGFGLSHFLKENKGARLFFGLSLISVTANFTILGALIYSVVQFDDLLGDYPGFASWVVTDASSVFLTIVGAAVVLVPITLLSYTIMARRSARWLTALYLIANAGLLIPVRTSLWTGLIATALVAAGLMVTAKKSRGDETLSTFEGRFSCLTLFVPSGIIFARNLYLYQMDALVVLAMSLTGFLVLRHLSVKLDLHSRVRGILDVASLPLVVSTGAALTVAFDGLLDEALMIPLFALALVPLFVDLVNRSEGARRSAVFGFVGAFLFCGSFSVNELLTSDTLASLIAVTAAVATVIYGYMIRQKWVIYVGVVTTVSLTLENIANFILWFDFNNWIALSILGASAIIAASVLERHGASIKLRLESWRKRAQFGDTQIPQP